MIVSKVGLLLFHHCTVATVVAAIVDSQSIDMLLCCCLQDDAGWQDWLAAVMRLLLGFPMRLQLPSDRNGLPDFSDACKWQGSIVGLAVDGVFRWCL
jgi:hypothetical protein